MFGRPFSARPGSVRCCKERAIAGARNVKRWQSDDMALH
jgi:hypothetical protein